MEKIQQNRELEKRLREHARKAVRDLQSVRFSFGDILTDTIKGDPHRGSWELDELAELCLSKLGAGAELVGHVSRRPSKASLSSQEAGQEGEEEPRPPPEDHVHVAGPWQDMTAKVTMEMTKVAALSLHLRVLQQEQDASTVLSSVVEETRQSIEALT